MSENLPLTDRELRLLEEIRLIRRKIVRRFDFGDNIDLLQCQLCQRVSRLETDGQPFPHDSECPLFEHPENVVPENGMPMLHLNLKKQADGQFQLWYADKAMVAVADIDTHDHGHMIAPVWAWGWNQGFKEGLAFNREMGSDDDRVLEDHADATGSGDAAREPELPGSEAPASDAR